MIIETDKYSGFCFGVNKAINKVEELLSDNPGLVCLGEIVHNHEEVERLSSLGMKTVDLKEIPTIHHNTVLIRTHGEPPSTYQKLKTNNNRIIDATCPVVLKLQERIRKSYLNCKGTPCQLAIFGKKNHPEVIGLNGQVDNQAIVVTTPYDLSLIDFTRPIELYSQTTMSFDDFISISEIIKERAKNEVVIHDTICRQVANRIPRLAAFSKQFDIILFVSGKNSSNGKQLFETCLKNNPRSYFISAPGEIQKNWFSNCESIGISGATSTPRWLLEKVKSHVSTILNV